MAKLPMQLEYWERNREYFPLYDNIHTIIKTAQPFTMFYDREGDLYTTMEKILTKGNLVSKGNIFILE
jgi:hypothetical protein